MRKNEEGKMPSKFLEKVPVSLIAGGRFTFTTYHDLFCLTLSVYRDLRGVKLINAEKRTSQSGFRYRTSFDRHPSYRKSHITTFFDGCFVDGGSENDAIR